MSTKGPAGATCGAEEVVRGARILPGVQSRYPNRVHGARGKLSRLQYDRSPGPNGVRLLATPVRQCDAEPGLGCIESDVGLPTGPTGSHLVLGDQVAAGGDDSDDRKCEDRPR